jgi:hypothetical protein
VEYFKYLSKMIEDGLNAQLSSEEQQFRPFRIYPDVGDFDFATRDLNDIIGKKYGVLSLIASNVSPLRTIKFAELTAQCEIVVNVDEMTVDADDIGCMHYAPVAEARQALTDFISAYNGKSRSTTIENKDYTVTTTFTLATAGSFVVTTSNLGKIVPLRFTVTAIFVESGVSSDNVSYTITYNGDDYTLYAIQASENMVGTSEGQTHSGDSRVGNTIQEAKYSLELSMPVTDNDLCKHLLSLIHNGVDNQALKLTVNYGVDGLSGFEHWVIVSNISLSVQRPQNVGINLSFIEADDTISGV